MKHEEHERMNHEEHEGPRRGVYSARVVPFVFLLFVTFVVTPEAQFSLVSVEQEIEIGKQANAQVRKEIPEVRHAQAEQYIRSIGQRLIQHAGGPKYPYSFSMADYREINAFALPGGPIWIHRGVLHAATNESQVAGVLAHEVAHIAQRHAASQMTKGMVANLGLGLLGAVLGNSAGAGAAQAAAGLLANGAFLKFSRDDEREADQVGLQMLRRAGWDGRGMVELFEILQREAKRNPGSVEIFFSSHPAPQDRITRLQSQIRPGGTRDTRQFQAMKAALLKLPPAKAMPRE
jgi:predicted Zn-dependent protease